MCLKSIKKALRQEWQKAQPSGGRDKPRRLTAYVLDGRGKPPLADIQAADVKPVTPGQRQGAQTLAAPGNAATAAEPAGQEVPVRAK